jgi:DNA-binding PadR family transcriptional regulator
MRPLTDSELLVLGLVAEMPRHAYELEQVIASRNMREWTQIGFSSIYFVLGRLEGLGLVDARKPSGNKAKKVFSVTRAGRITLRQQAIAALGSVRPSYGPVLLGMVHWPALERDQALAALASRTRAVGAERERILELQISQQPLPDHVEAIFEYVLGQLRAEEEWVGRTLDYMTTKPWLEE